MTGYEIEQVDGPPPVRISGRVKWFDAGKGYGFVVPDDPNLTDLKDVLLHVGSQTQSAEFCLQAVKPTVFADRHRAGTVQIKSGAVRQTRPQVTRGHQQVEMSSRRWIEDRLKHRRDHARSHTGSIGAARIADRDPATGIG